MSSSQRLNGFCRELISSGLHVFENVLVGISDDEAMLEHLDLGPDGKILRSRGRTVECNCSGWLWSTSVDSSSGYMNALSSLPPLTPTVLARHMLAKSLTAPFGLTS